MLKHSIFLSAIIANGKTYCPIKWDKCFYSSTFTLMGMNGPPPETKCEYSEIH